MKLSHSLKMIAIAALVGGLVAAGAYLLMDRYLPGAISIEPGSREAMVVQVDGAVATPGVYVVPFGSRLNDAIVAAGGLAPNADTTAINLAGRIGDGELIAIPARLVEVSDDTVEPPAEAPGLDRAGLIDINNAGVSELDQLPGVGPVIAQRIVDFREFYGPFESVNQLAEVEGISQDMVEEFRHMVTIGG